MPDTPVVYSDALRGLGDTPDKVADSLRRQEVRGVRNAVRTFNPVVRYLNSRGLVPVSDFDLTSGSTVRFLSTRSGLQRELTLPTAVRQFLEAFNRGEYPDLELPDPSN